MEAERLKKIASPRVTNVLPKSIGVKLVDTNNPHWRDDPEGASYVHHLVDANTQLPVAASRLNAKTLEDNQPSVSIELWEQAGSVASRELSENTSIDHGEQAITGLPSLPAGAPIEVDLSIDEEGMVSLAAREPSSGRDLQFSVQLSVMSPEQVEAARKVQSGMSIST